LDTLRLLAKDDSLADVVKVLSIDHGVWDNQGWESRLPMLSFRIMFPALRKMINLKSISIGSLIFKDAGQQDRFFQKF